VKRRENMRYVKHAIEITAWLAMCFTMAVILMTAWAEKKHQSLDVSCMQVTERMHTGACWVRAE
jgi:hypothetical protein